MTDAGFDVSGRRALVTGASSGIGAAIALRLARAGANVVCASRRGTEPDPSQVGDGTIRARLHGLVADLSEPGVVEEVVDRSVRLVGGLDILVNNAATADWLPVGDVDLERFDATMRLNVWAPIRISELARPHLAVSGDGVVVNIGSVDATRPSAGAVLYGASKGALSAATIVMAKEFAADGIRVVQIDPGLIETPLAAEMVVTVDASESAINLVDRAGSPEEIAGAVHYVVSDLGRFTNAVSLRIDGGALALGPWDDVSS